METLGSASAFNRIELLMHLPLSWPAGGKRLQFAEYRWPEEWLRTLAQSICEGSIPLPGTHVIISNDEAMHLVRLAMVEIGHAILDMTPKQAGYIVGTVAYEAVETAVLAAIEAGLAAATVGTAGGATPATAGGTAAIVSAKAASFSKLVYRLSKKADLLDFPKIAKAIDRLNEMVVWMIKYPMCFVAGTKVHTLSGLKNIEDIQRDDWVLTRDEDNPTSENRYRRVTELFQTSPSRLLTIAYRNDVTGVEESLTCTGEHPFFVSGREELPRKTGSGRSHLDDESALLTQPEVAVNELRHGSFIPAGRLEVGDTLVLADGHEATIISIDEQSAAEGETFTTYNLAVDGDHTYFVGASGVWVHNTGNPCDEAFEIFAKKFSDTDNPIEAAKAARNHLDTLVDATEVGPAMYRKHYRDLEQLVVGQFQSDRGRTAWKDYLTGIKGAAPVDMPNPHAHHILFKKGLGEAQQLLVREGQDLLRKVGIDPLFGEEVLYWAPNGVKDQHSHSTLLSLIEDLRELANKKADRSKYVEVLREHARDAAERR
jgi:hypothetical protein